MFRVSGQLHQKQKTSRIYILYLSLLIFPSGISYLICKALAEGKQWYFYSRRTQNRITENGYWNPTGIEESVVTSANRTVGMKKCLGFYIGEAPAGMKTSWIMEEYRLLSSDSSSSSRRKSSKTRANPKTDHSKWVICKVYERSCDEDDDDGAELSCLDEVFLSLDDLDEISLPN
ncbi:NAC domain-containing protein 104 isoform X2 [Manihot esculenta]|uniref:Uncharacterized protein n=1 Tax=Manihot esculenta TaxID=3983 RepID=A0ACB7GVY5_MANES|nr:NAC domain-containing protein 104 isoform X2 [Manihot esculenta]KAG8644116.1 hypothetical protein MANES_11G100100v8 [Manihot esculenta]